jgi:hypothetical protein
VGRLLFIDDLEESATEDSNYSHGDLSAERIDELSSDSEADIKVSALLTENNDIPEIEEDSCHVH